MYSKYGYLFFQQPEKITLIPLNILGTECTLGSECTIGLVCNASSNRCVDCDQGTKPDEEQEKCIPSMFYDFIFQRLSKITLIQSLNCQGKTCDLDTDCSKDQICDTNKCVPSTNVTTETLSELEKDKTM